MSGTKGNIGSIVSFQTDQSKPPKFLSIYNEKLPKGVSKFQLYMYQETDNFRGYVRQPVLGVFGMSEYAQGQYSVKSLVNQTKTVYPPSFTDATLDFSPQNSTEIISPLKTVSTDRFEVEKGNIKNTVTEIAKMDTPMGRLAKTLLPALDSKVKLTVSDVPARGRFRADIGIIIDKSFLYDHSISDE